MRYYKITKCPICGKSIRIVRKKDSSALAIEIRAVSGAVQHLSKEKFMKLIQGKSPDIYYEEMQVFIVHKCAIGRGKYIRKRRKL